MNIAKGLSLDLKIYEGNDRNTLNVFSARASYIERAAYSDKRAFALDVGTAITVSAAETTRVFVLYSSQPVQVTAVVEGNTDPVIFSNQIMLVISGVVDEVVIENTSSKTTEITILRFSQKEVISNQPIMNRQLITFAPLARISQLPQSIVNINNVRVQNITLANWTYDQAVAPSTGITVTNKYRICNSDGTPNVNGQYIMILNDNVSQENFSGTLQLWVEEVSGN